MTFRDDSSHAPNEHHALVAGQQQPGDALMVQQNAGAIAPPLIPGMPTPGAHHVLRVTRPEEIDRREERQSPRGPAGQGTQHLGRTSNSNLRAALDWAFETQPETATISRS